MLAFWKSLLSLFIFRLRFRELINKELMKEFRLCDQVGQTSKGKYYIHWINEFFIFITNIYEEKNIQCKILEMKIMNGQWLCIKLNMKNWAYRLYNLHCQSIMYELKKLTNVLEEFFMYVIMNEWANEWKHVVVAVENEKEISLAIQRA